LSCHGFAVTQCERMMLVMNETMAMMATVAVATNACFSIILLF